MFRRRNSSTTAQKTNFDCENHSQPDPSRWDSKPHPYAGQIAVLATKHDKLPLIAPALESMVGLKVEAVEVDTDILGTFTGDVPRQGTPLETAIAKARLGMKATQTSIGIASEGSIGPDPAIPLITSDKEIVVLVDDNNDTVIWESHTSWDIVTSTTTLKPGDDLEGFLSKADFPHHKAIVRPNHIGIQPIFKGIDAVEDLIAAISKCAEASPDGLARVETDLRALACPSRREVIAAAAQRLASRVAARCPACGSPGWGAVDVLRGIPCEQCGTEVPKVREEVNGCSRCNYRSNRPIVAPDATADPSQCPYCNP